MTEHEPHPDPDLAARLRALPPEPVDPAYRARARAAFLSPPAARPARRRFPLWGGIGIAAAAALALFLLATAAPSWRVAGVQGSGTVTVDGEAFPAASLAGRKLPRGASVDVGPGVELTVAADALSFVVGEGSRLTLETRGIPGRRSLAAVLDHGNTWGTTGPGFAGLAVLTPEAQVQVTGTTFAVMASPDTTCVCVLEGTVEVVARSAPGEPVAVPGGDRCFLFAAPVPPRLDELTAPQAARLREIRQRRSG
jgi:ferric-dicitrate binding protein FerR (iron transport regulator)